MDRHVDAGPHEAAVAPPIALLIDHVAVQRALGHPAERIGFARHVVRLRALLDGRFLQLLARVAQEIAEALIDPQPLPVQADVHDPDRRRVERRPVETLAVNQVGRPRAHLAFEHLAVPVVIVAVGLEAQQVPHPHAQLGPIHGLGEEVLGSGAQPEHPGVAIVEGGDHDDGNVLGGEVALESCGHLVAVHARHHDVEQDEVGRLLRHHGERFLAAGGGPEVKPVRREHDLSTCRFWRSSSTISMRAGRAVTSGVGFMVGPLSSSRVLEQRQRRRRHPDRSRSPR